MTKGVLSSLYTRPGHCVPFSCKSHRSGIRRSGVCLKDWEKLFLAITVTSITLVEMALILMFIVR